MEQKYESTHGCRVWENEELPQARKMRQLWQCTRKRAPTTVALVYCQWSGRYFCQSSDHWTKITGKGEQGNSRQDSEVVVDVWIRFSLSVRSLSDESEVARSSLQSSLILRWPSKVCIVSPCGRPCWWMEYQPKSSTSCATIMRVQNALSGCMANSLTASMSPSCVRQGCILSPMTLNITIDWIMNHAGASPFVVGKNLSVQDLDYTDDITLLADSVEAGQTFLDNVAAAAAKLGPRISGPKTKVVSFGYDTQVITLKWLSWWHFGWSCAYLCLLGILHFRRFHYIFRWVGMPNRQGIWCLCQTEGVCHKFEDKAEDLQCYSHHHFVVCFWVLDALGNRLDEIKGFPDELSSLNTWGNPTRPATEWHDTSPLHGSVGVFKKIYFLQTTSNWIFSHSKAIDWCKNLFFLFLEWGLGVPQSTQTW